MDLFAYGRALSDMWALGGQTMIAAQEATMKAVAGTMGANAVPGAFPTGAFPAGGFPGAIPDLASFTDLATGTADAARAGQAMAELWSTAAGLAQALSRQLPGEQSGDPTVAATFHKMIDPRAWLGATGEMDEMLARLSEGPRFADLWDVERRTSRVMRAWLAVRQHGLEHNALLLGAWQRAAQLFSAKLTEPARAEHARDPKATLRLWTETANAVLIETQRSEPFLESQATMVRASTELRLAQQDLVEYYGERFGFPTRRELDDLAKSVTELRRELRQLRRAARADHDAQAAPPAPLPPSPPPPAAIEAQRVTPRRKARV